MLVQQGDGRSYGADQRLAWWLAGTAGALNAAGFDAVGLFSANMTGNISALADRAGLGQFPAAIPLLGLVLTFVAGATGSTVLVNLGRRRGMARIYALSILAEAVLLALLGCADLWLQAPARGRVLAFGLSFLMGLQNAVVTRISNARVRTTHVTGMVTDIGIEIANLIGQRHSAAPEAVRNRENLRLHVQTVLAFLLGGVAGVAVYRRFGPALIFVAAALLFGLALRGLTSRTAAPVGRAHS